MTPCKDNSKWENLMEIMLSDSLKSDTIYQPGDYWRKHASSMIETVRKIGIESFREGSESCLNAFATGKNFQPNKSYRNKLWSLHNLFLRFPFLKLIARKYESEIFNGWEQCKNQATYKLRVIYALIKEIAPDLEALEDPLIGNPVVYNIEDKVYSEVYLEKLLEIACLRKYFDFSHIKSVIEIGGSYGLLSSILVNLYPSIKYVLVDISPVSAFAEYYLSKVFPGQINGYLETRKENSLKPLCYEKQISILCSHQINNISNEFDLFINTASFQEMDIEQVKIYSNFASSNCKWAYLNNTKKAKLTGMTESDYEKALKPMIKEKDWLDILHPSYRPMLLKIK